ncbi:SDR family NAD(P)-dependent oxidoreductase [soil metagenome]
MRDGPDLLSRFSLDGRTAVVTGAAGGLGREFAKTLAKAGAYVACIDRDGDGLDETVTDIGPVALGIVADVADEEMVSNAVGAISDWRTGPVDILVNNAGISTPPVRMGEVTLADWDRGMAINLRSVFLLTRAMLPLILQSQRGSIINITSYLALKGVYPGFPVTAMPYTASKAAIVGITHQLAAEYADMGLRVNAIAPGWHAGTQLGRERRAAASFADDKRFMEFLCNSPPLGRVGQPEELSELLLFLASDASRYVTGQVIAHDGGLTAV